MKRIRVIPILLIEDRKLVKTSQFKKPSYVGDPINALKIFNEKEVDEICVLDIGATKKNRQPDLEYIKILASECFMPLSYGGGITSCEQARRIFQAGVEKIILGTSVVTNPGMVREISAMAGAQSVIISIDVKKNWRGKFFAYVGGAMKSTKMPPLEFAKYAENLGAGEILLQSVESDGMLKGYNLELIEMIAHAVRIPLIASGGAASIDDFLFAAKAGASAVGAGAFFIYKGPHRAVLINYPDQQNLKVNLYSKL